MTPEAKVKKKVVEQLKELRAYYFYPVTGCYEGLFFGIECKAGNNKPTPLQEKNLEEINDAGGLDLVINEESMGNVANVLRAWSVALYD